VGGRAPALTRDSYADLSGSDLSLDVATVRRLVEERGMELLVLDQTRPDNGLPVVKVNVPRERHFPGRFGPRARSAPERSAERSTTPRMERSGLERLRAPRVAGPARTSR